MDKKSLMDKIVDETLIILSAIEAKDIDIVLGALEERSTLIEAFISSSNEMVDVETKLLILKFDTLNKVCEEKLVAFNHETESDLYALKSQKTVMKHTQKVHQNYTQLYNQSVGTAFDLKK